MSGFWTGYLAAVATYLVIGLCIGITIVWRHLAYFFAAGWQVKRMLLCIGVNVVAWPSAVLSIQLNEGE